MASPTNDLRFLQFGIFMAMYAETEAELREVLRQVVGIDKATALAIFSGTRTAEASSFIRRCYEARKKPIPPLLDGALSRLSVITTFRNDLIHYGTDLFAKSPVVTNESVTIRPDAIRRVPFDNKTLFDFEFDLAVVNTILRGFPKISAVQRKLRQIDGPPSWLGKALAPTPQDRKKPKPDTHPKPKPPRAPSRG